MTAPRGREGRTLLPGILLGMVCAASGATSIEIDRRAARTIRQRQRTDGRSLLREGGPVMFRTERTAPRDGLSASLLVLVFGPVSAAAMGQPSPTPTQASPSSAGPCSAIVASAGSTPCAAGTQLMTGTVWAYRPGQIITIRVDEGKQYEMALEPGVRVDGSVAVGHLAALMWTTDTAGKTRVMSITAAPGSAMDIERSAPSVDMPTPRPTPVPATSTPSTPHRTPRRAGPTPTP